MAEADQDPQIVLVTDRRKVAEAVVEMLAAAGIESELQLPRQQVATDVLTGLTEAGPEGEIAVRVVDPARLDDARKYLSEASRAAALHALHQQRAERTGTVMAVCEDCGQESEWPAAAMGTTETCPFCTHYMDVPDPDDDWSGVDFGNEDDPPAEEDKGEGEK